MTTASDLGPLTPDAAQAADLARLGGARALLDNSVPGAGKTLVAVERDIILRTDAMEAALAGRPGPRLGPTLIVTRPGQIDGWAATLRRQLRPYGVDPRRVHAWRLLEACERAEAVELLTELTHRWPAGGSAHWIVVPWSVLQEAPARAAPGRAHWGRDTGTPALQRVPWFHVVLEEAHAIGRHTTSTYRAASHLPATHRTAATATPARTRPEQIFSILRWLHPGNRHLRSYWRWAEGYFHIETGEAYRGGRRQSFREVGAPRRGALERLARELAPFTVRRTLELPPGVQEVRHTELRVDLTPTQRRQYEQMREHLAARTPSGALLTVDSAMAALQRLQQLTLGTLEPGHPDPMAARVALPSPKIEAVLDLLDEDPDLRIVVFSQFIGGLRLLAEQLREAKIPYGEYTGENRKAREADSEAFRRGRRRVMLATFAAGGEAIDGWQLAASTVVLLDRPWSPALREQAIGRLYRRGQTNLVHVISVSATHTVDEIKDDVLNIRQAWLDTLRSVA